MSVCERKKIVLVPLVIPKHPCAKQWSFCSFPCPQFLEQRILAELPVVCNSLLCDRVYHTIAVFFDLYYWTCILLLGKTTGDCEGRGISESKTNNMIQCLAQNFARGFAGNDPGGASWGG